MSILRKLFGPSKDEIWAQFASSIGAEYVGKTFWKGDKVVATHGEWTVTLDTFTTVVSTGKSMVVIPFTRMRAPYVNPEAFRFTIERRGVFSGIAKWFGMQDIEIGIEPFDRDFILKSNDPTRLRALLENVRLRELVSAQPKIHLTVKDDEGWFGPQFPAGVDELYFVTGGIIKDPERLKLLFELFAEALDQLCRIGSAYEKPPGVHLP